MTMLEIVPMDRVRVEDVLDLALRLRQEHVDEVLASGGYNPREAIEKCMGAPGERSCLVDARGRVEAIFGAAPTAVPGVAIVWLLSSKDVHVYRQALVETAPRVIDYFLEEFTMLTNFVDARFEASLRWAKAMGFRVDPPRPFGPLGMPFHQIFRGRLPHV